MGEDVEDDAKARKILRKATTRKTMQPSGDAEPGAGAKAGGAMRAIVMAKKTAAKAKGKRGRKGGSKLFGPPKMKNADAWIEVWNDERKNRELFAQEFRGFPVKQASNSAEIFGTILYEWPGDQWASNGYMKPTRREFLGSGGWPPEWGGPKASDDARALFVSLTGLAQWVCARGVGHISARRGGSRDVR